MKKAIALFLLTVMCLSCEQDKLDSPPEAGKPGMVIDVRTAREYDAGHLQDAINIPYDEIGERIADHVQDKEGEITLYCRSGRRSAIGKQTLDELGYKHVVDAGAYAKLKAQTEGQSKQE